MEFLIEALDGDPGDLGRTAHGPLTTEVEPDVEREALAFLRRLDLPIMPRKQWPSLGGLPRYGVKGRIAEAHRAEEGRALCYWSDGGWGEMVRGGKQEDERFAEKLVEACTSLFREWEPDPRPEWVTCIPSLTNRRLVPDFARRLAAELDLPFREALVKTEKRRPQKTMANSPHQARNVDGSLAPVGTRLPTTPVLLIDDIVGSRWTFTVASWLLRTHGTGAVWPLALASLGVRQ